MKRFYSLNEVFEIYENVFPTITELENIEDNEWYLRIKEYFDEFSQLNYADRIINRKFETMGGVYSYIQRKIRLNLLVNVYKYSKTYETTVLEYNPLWNVDGTEIREVEREKDGTNTDNYNEQNELKKTGTIANAKTGNDKNEERGTSTNIQSKTTMDSSTFYDTEKNVESPNIDNTTIYNSTNTQTNNTSDVDKHTGSKSNTYGEQGSEKETLTRQGNIGVTKTTELLTDQRRLVDFSFIEWAVHQIVNDFTYLVD